MLAPAIADRRAVVHQRPDHGVHALAALRDLWVEANRRAHTRIVGLLEGGRSERLVLDDDTVYLDLSPAVDRVKASLQERGLDADRGRDPAVDRRRDRARAVRRRWSSLQRGVRLLKAIAIVLPLLSLLCLAGSVFLSRSRRRGLLHAAIGVALAMLLLVAALGVRARPTWTRSARARFPRDAAAGIFDTIVTFLRDGVRMVLIVVRAARLVAFLFGLPLGAPWARIVTDSRRRWVAVHRNALLLVVVRRGRDGPGLPRRGSAAAPCSSS